MPGSECGRLTAIRAGYLLLATRGMHFNNSGPTNNCPIDISCHLECLLKGAFRETTFSWFQIQTYPEFAKSLPNSSKSYLILKCDLFGIQKQEVPMFFTNLSKNLCESTNETNFPAKINSVNITTKWQIGSRTGLYPVLFEESCCRCEI